MPVFNVESLLGEKKTINWQDKSYDVVEMNVEMSLRAERVVEQLGNEANDPMVSYHEMVKLIEELVPGLNVSALPARVIPAIFFYIASSKVEPSEVVAAMGTEMPETSGTPGTTRTAVKKNLRKPVKHKA